MKVRPGYKQTEAGVIPDEWEVSTVGHEFEIKLGKMLDAEKNVGVPKPYLGNRAVQWGRIDITDLPTVPMSRADIEKYRLCKGDLLVCEGGEVGRAAIWDAPISECYYQKALHRLRPLHGFNSQVMVALLQQWSDRGVLKNYVTQTSIAHLPREKFVEVPMPVPPVLEQRAIAAALSDVDALLDGLDRLIAKKRDLKQAAMQQLLTGQTRLPGFSGEWDTKTLFDLAERKKELFDDGDWIESEHITTEGIRLIQTGNISVGSFIEKETKKFIYEKSFISLRCKQLRTGDLLVCRLADPAGRACVLPDIGEERIVTSVDVTIFRPSHEIADRVFLRTSFRLPNGSGL
jgi:type I restriction enzyme S subunit